MSKQIIYEAPFISYEQDRAENGFLSFTEKIESRELYSGVHYEKRLYHRGNGERVLIYLAVLSSDAPAAFAVSAAPSGTIKMVKHHAAEFDGHVICAMNASFFHFFNDGDLTPYGIQIVRGKEINPPGNDKPQYSDNWIGMTKRGEMVIGNAEDYYVRWRGNLEYAVGGGARLIRDGKIALPSDGGQHPRTTVGISTDGTLILMCADGRSSFSSGLTYGDIVDLYLGLGYEIKELLNLDGGGSTTFVLREHDGSFRVQNIPSGPPLPISYQKYGLPTPVPCGDSQARGVADCILIVATDL